MKLKEMFETNFDYYEFYKSVLRRDGFKCQFKGCESRSVQLAHIIAQTQDNAKMIKRLWQEMFGEEIQTIQAWAIIHCKANVRTSCPKHNSYFNKGNDPEYVKRFLNYCKVNTEKIGFKFEDN